jgi:glycosyltransferase involved in cell wall biosynthesis
MKYPQNDNLPLVSIVIPCRNEEKYIEKCLESIVANDYPGDQLEILVVDGRSEDRTREIVEGLVDKYSAIRLLDNAKKATPAGLNTGIRQAKGELVIIMGTHTTYDSDYVSNCVKSLAATGADCVGGVCVTQPGSGTRVASAIAFTLSSPFGVGNAYFRIGIEESREVDTVPFGCYKREVFDRIGLFDEKLLRNQDIEFNLRLQKAGGKILLVPDIVSYYVARSSLKAFLGNCFLNGLWNIYTVRIASMKLSLRHYVPLLFVGSIMLSAIMIVFLPIFKWLLSLIFISYFLAAFGESFRISFKKGFKCVLVLPFMFLGLHFSYGLGSLWGLLAFWKK